MTQLFAGDFLIVRRSFFGNALWNLLGAILPLCVGLFSIPFLVRELGVERFGLLNLSWLLVGYFSLFDLGIGRALTRLLAEKIAQGQDGELPNLVNTALVVMRWLGLGAGLLLALLAPWLAGWMRVSPEIQDEMRLALWVMSLTLPFVVLSVGWRGVLEAYGRFDLVNWVRIPLGISIFLAPVIVLLFVEGLVPVVISLAFTRVAGWWLTRYLCWRAAPFLARKGSVDRALLRPLLSFGGWMTVSNIVGPLMVYADRFLIGGLLSAVAVAYYATPYEIVTRLWVVSGALTGVLFPLIAGKFAVDRKIANGLYERAMKVLFLAMLPVVSIVFLFAEPGLAWWLNLDFAKNGYLVTQVLVVGVFINALGQIAITTLHGAGRADWAARLHLLELPFYLLVLVYAAQHHGIQGVAFAWLLRVVVDTVLMTFLVDRLMMNPEGFFQRLIGSVGVAAGLFWWMSDLTENWSRLLLIVLITVPCTILLFKQARLLGLETGKLAGLSGTRV
ncbi:MAG: flippase [Rhodocyclaceae bacterium]|nr:flippase [Rhodocyclaceae bacterium]